MMTRTAVSDEPGIEAYIAATCGPSADTLRSLDEHLADDVTFAGMGGRVASGKEEVKDMIKADRLARYYADSEWSLVSSEDDTSTLRAKFAPDSPAAGVELTLMLDGERRVQRIELMGLREEAPLTDVNLLDERLRPLIDKAWEVSPILVAYVDEQGAPHVSMRGSVHVQGEHELGIWIYSQGLARALPVHPGLALWYGNETGEIPYRIMLEGTGHIATAEEDRRRVYEGAPAHEQAHDPEMRGAAVIVTVKRVAGRTPYAQFNMSRTA